MRIIRQQQGLTAIGTVAVVVLVGFIGLVVLRLIPMYLEYFSVASALNSLEDDSELGKKTKAEIYKMLKRRFEINDVKHVEKDDIKITQAKGRTTVAVKYEARSPMLGNIDFIGTFEKTVAFP